MSIQPPIKHPSRLVLDIALLQQVVVELDEKSEEALTAGAIGRTSGIKYPVIVR
ncbi:MAG: hypothetical protein F6K28_46390 [Microcoleus sp. SIO2G3]|nr:hypothetical protein [Microcoleus sp. SIO2G3]